MIFFRQSAGKEGKMRSLMSRITGITLISMAILGVLFSITAIVLTNRFLNEARTAIVATGDLTERTLLNTARGLYAARTSLEEAQTTLSAIHQTLDGVTATVEGFSPALEAFHTLLGESLPAAIRTTQVTLQAAQAAAQTLDIFLYGLSQVPILSNFVRPPEVALHTAIGEVNSSLDNIPAALQDAQKGVQTASTENEKMESGLETISGQMSRIEEVVLDMKNVVEEYLILVEDLQMKLLDFEKRLLTWVTIFRVLMTFILVWLALAQVSLFLQGWELLVHGFPGSGRAPVATGDMESPKP
jgi:methyl-accepting chemotaxis protein